MEKTKTALITGCSGQDGSYLTEFLLDKGYKVKGLVRRASTNAGLWRLKEVLNNPNFELIEDDVTDFSSIQRIIFNHYPDEIYNLAAQSHVYSSFNQPIYTTNATYLGCLNILEVLREKNNQYKPKFYQASSSEMFGDNYTEGVLPVKGTIGGFQCGAMWQDINTPFNPQSPYGIAKLAAHQAVKLYRKSYDIFACSGILFNHESPRRGEQFVTRKVTSYVQDLRNWMNNHICLDVLFNEERKMELATYPKVKLGNLNAKRDWGFAKEYVEAMWLMLQQNKPDDYIVATGETHSVEEFVKLAFEEIGLNWKDFVEIDQSLFRPSEVPYLCGHSNTKEKLGWEPKVTFKELVKIMVNNES